MPQDIKLLKEEGIYPEDHVLEENLGPELFAVYNETAMFLVNDCGLTLQWNYYRDGKSWLGKVLYKKKTICWLSAWSGHLKLSFYFSAKTRGGLENLKIKKATKQRFLETKPVGKLYPLILRISRSDQLGEFRTIVLYKMSVV